MDSIQQSSEQTLLFCEQAARLLASIKEQYSAANVLMDDEDVKDLEGHINTQIQSYTTPLEIYGGLKIVSASVKNINGTDLELKMGVKEHQRLYKNSGIGEHESYIGWHEGKDLYVTGGKLRVRSSPNPKHDVIVTLDVSQTPEAREARERLKFMYTVRD